MVRPVFFVSLYKAGKFSFACKVQVKLDGDIVTVAREREK